MPAKRSSPTAAILVIGDEILTGRTKERNAGYIADLLNLAGIVLREVRIVPDEEEAIVHAVNALRHHVSYLFTTGGIGPTHDDITADAVARAFDVPIDVDPEARAILEAHYEKSGTELNAARLRMARIPQGASLIANSVSAAPGFRLGNVFVLAGVPSVMQAMMGEVMPQLETGVVVHSATVEAGCGEGDIAEALADLQRAHSDVAIGSYPFHDGRRFRTRVVARSSDVDVLARVRVAIEALVAAACR